MSFEEASAHLDALGIDAMKSLTPTLERIEALCEAMDHPERRAAAIHVTGTNGKSSVARMATALLDEAGLNVGTFTSPHLESVTERISLGGAPITEAEFGEVFATVKPYIDVVEKRLDERLSYFETLVGMFFLWCADAPVDAMVVEVGLGGRWDATNVISAPVAVITGIGLDHTAMLGEAKEQIAAEKAGIIKPNSVLVTGERFPDILEILTDEAHSVRASDIAVIDREFEVLDDRIALGGRYVDLRSSASDYRELYLPVHGRHQVINAAIALEAVTRFIPGQPLERDLVLEGFSKLTIPGRLEIIRPATEDAPAVVLDVAHNAEGMSALVDSLLETFAFEQATIVLGILADKDHVGMLSELGRVPARIIATKPRNVRAVEPEQLRDQALAMGLSAEVVSDVSVAVDVALRETSQSDLVVVSGSHYVVGEARPYLSGTPG
jgi:dihydrofolate synthase / folylpolyglutamate synthase